MVDVDALVTAGGRGSRMKDVPGEKPMVPLLGRPMIDYVIDALQQTTGIDDVYVSVSGNVPLTEKHLQERNVKAIMTSGSGYVPDLREALSHVRSEHVLICPADLPLITSQGIGSILVHFDDAGVESLSVAVPSSMVRALGAVPSYCLDIDGREVVLCGVSIVHRETMLSGATLSQGFMVMEDDRFGLNVNTREEMVVAEELLRRRKGEHHP
ncbi:MAG TPA: NTP transferase domain-containing protein [Methanomassiliicoccaceae archaeon]|nr:NTP transferase domain-containing protein [Methanomassiliicoccaceae archaeon]